MSLKKIDLGEEVVRQVLLERPISFPTLSVLAIMCPRYRAVLIISRSKLPQSSMWVTAIVGVPPWCSSFLCEDWPSLKALHLDRPGGQLSLCGGS